MSLIEPGLYKHHRQDLYVQVIGTGYLVKDKTRIKNINKLRNSSSLPFCYLYCNKKKASIILNPKTLNSYDLIPHDDINSIPSYWFYEKIILYKNVEDKHGLLIARDYTNFFGMTCRGVSNFVKIKKENVA